MSQQFLMKNSAFLNALFYSSTSRVAAQLLSHVQLFCDPRDCSTPSFPALQHLPEHVQTHVHSVSDAINHLVLCHPLLLLPSIFPSIRVFSNKSALRIRWLKYQGSSFSISLSNEYSGLISFRIDWIDLAVCSYVGVLTKQRLKIFESQLLLIALWFQENY